MSGLVEFLNARLDEDERVATAPAATAGGLLHSQWDVRDHGGMAAVFVAGRVYRLADDVPDDVAAHIARHDPARVLREVEAKRRIIDEHRPPRSIALVSVDRELGTRTAADDGTTRCRVCTSMDGHGATRFAGPCPTLRLLALPYAGHPDYRQEWTQ